MKDKTLAYLMQAGELLAEKPRFPSKRKCQEPKLIPVLQFVNLSWEQEQTVENDMSRTSGGLLSLYLFWHPLSLVCKWATLFWTRRWSFSVLKVAQAQHPNLNSLLQRCGCRKWFAFNFPRHHMLRWSWFITQRKQSFMLSRSSRPSYVQVYQCEWFTKRSRCL